MKVQELSDTIKFAAEGILPDSVFIEVNKVSAESGMTTVAADTVELDASGVGIYSIDTPVSISATGEYEYIKIFVYTDDSFMQKVTQLTVRPILLEF